MGNDEDFFGKFFGGFILIWIISALISLAAVGVGIWAVIKLVSHFTG